MLDFGLGLGLGFGAGFGLGFGSRFGFGYRIRLGSVSGATQLPPRTSQYLLTFFNLRTYVLTYLVEARAVGCGDEVHDGAVVVDGPPLLGGQLVQCTCLGAEVGYGQG